MYLATVERSSALWGEQVESATLSAQDVADCVKNPEKGDTVTTYTLTGKTAETLIYNGVAWEKPKKPRKKREKREKVKEYEQVSLF